MPPDAPTFVVTAGGLTAWAVLVACAVPAIRAARVEPAAALRQE